MASNAMLRERLFALREQIARIEGKPPPGLGETTLKAPETISRMQDAAWESGMKSLFPEGLPTAGLIEIRSNGFADAGAVTGFSLGIAHLAARTRQGPKRIFWIGESQVGTEAGLPYAPGLRDFGLDPACIVYGAPQRLAEALWLADTALSSAAFAAILLEIRGNPKGFGLTESRRLSLKARDGGCLLLLLRHAGAEEAGSSLMRLAIAPMPAGLRRLPDGSPLSASLGNPIFRLMPEKSRGPAPADLSLEWDTHERLFYLAGRTGDAIRNRADAAHPVAAFSPSARGPDRPPALGSRLAS